MANRADIEFTSEGNTLRGWLYSDGGNGPQPLIVMAHGYAAVKEQYLDRYAEHFASLGLASLVFDHPNFGASDGKVRQEVDPWLQVRAYRDAISFAQTFDQIDAERIGVWGSSFSGGHALVTAAIDRRVKCVVSQVPTVDGFLASQRRTSPAQQGAAQERFDADRLARFQGEAPRTMPVTSREPGGSCALPGIDAYEFFHDTAGFAPNWRDEVTVRSAEMSREYSPANFIERISPTPLLMIVAMNDLLTLTDAQLAAYRDALEPKKLTTIPGGHFSPYVEEFDVTAEAAGNWFSQHLFGN